MDLTFTLTILAAALATYGTRTAGYALIKWFPKTLLELIVGTLLLVFGLQWLRKAILRSSGLKALHDEEEVPIALLALMAALHVALRALGGDDVGYAVASLAVLAFAVLALAPLLSE